MTNPDHAELKRQLRQRMRATPVDASRHNKRICESVADWLEQRPEYHFIAIFHPLPDEPDLRPVIGRLPGRVWYFPRIEQGEMSFHAVTDMETDLVPGTHGIREPKPSIPATPPDEIDAFFCPGLAFEKTNGGRLGRGKGYYDRYLAEARPSALLAGVTFPERLVDSTHTQPHDIRMHRIFC